MTMKAIQAWFACQMPGARFAWELILLTRQGGGFYVFAFELRDTFESTPQSSFEEAYQAFLVSAGLEEETENIPPFGDVLIVRIDTPYVDKVLVAINDPDYDDVCAVYGFAGTSFPNG